MATINTPVSLPEVTEQAGNYTYNAHIPLANWLRTASTMQKEVCLLAMAGMRMLTPTRPKFMKQRATTRRHTSSYTDTPTSSSRNYRAILTGTSPRTEKRSMLQQQPSVAT